MIALHAGARCGLIALPDMEGIVRSLLCLGLIALPLPALAQTSGQQDPGIVVEGSLENVRQMLANPNTLSGLSDGGAHVGAICDVSLPTWWRALKVAPEIGGAPVSRGPTRSGSISRILS